MPEFWVEDARALHLPDGHDRATELECLGESYTPRDLAPWRGHGAHVFRYDRGRRTYVGSVDDILAASEAGEPR